MRIVKKINPLLPKKKCHVIYNMVDFNIWGSSHNYIPRKDGKTNLIIAASHLHLKNLKNLVEAVNLLSLEKQRQLHINWYGDRINEPFFDDSFNAGMKKIIEYGLEEIFHFYKASNRIHLVMGDADAIGLFSKYEGFPNAVCEGMASGKTIISTSVSDVPSFINDSNLLCNAEDINSIVKSINYLLSLSNGELIEIGSKNREIAQLHFQKELIIEKYLSLLT